VFVSRTGSASGAGEGVPFLSDLGVFPQSQAELTKIAAEVRAKMDEEARHLGCGFPYFSSPPPPSTGNLQNRPPGCWE
jgi:hypothetical protein